MKIFALLLIILATLTVVPTANASQPPPPVGTTVCDQVTPSRCATINAADCVRQTGDYPQFAATNYQISQYLGIVGMPCPTDAFSPLRRSAWITVQVKDGSITESYLEDINATNIVSGYCSAYLDLVNRATGGAEGTYMADDYPAKMTTPPALFDRCNAEAAAKTPGVAKFTRWANQPYVPAAKPVADPEAAEPVTAPTAQKTTKCDAVAFGKLKVAVTALGINCNSGRNMLARYLRRGVEPKGYVCVTAKAGKVRVATCGTPGKAATKVTGRWRG